MNKYYLSLDGGGSKADVLLFDGQFNCLAFTRIEGTNRLRYSSKIIVENLKRGFDSLFSEFNPKKIECAYGTLLANDDMLREGISDYCCIERVNTTTEGRLGALSTGTISDAIVILAGTGSNVFYLKDKMPGKHYGGLGSLLGDEGSGYYLGRLALRAYEEYFHGLTGFSPLFDEINSLFGNCGFEEVVKAVYVGARPAVTIAGLSRLVGKYAALNDKLSVELIKKNFLLLAEDAVKFMKSMGFDASKPCPPVCFCGGLFKIHPLSFEILEKELFRYDSAISFKRPLFEPVVGGVIAAALESGKKIDNEFIELLKENYKNLLFGRS